MAGEQSHDFRELVGSQKALVARVLVRAGVAERDVPDLVQEVFIVALRRLPEWDGRAKLSTWFYRVAVRVASDHRRRAYQRRELLSGLDASTLEAPAGELNGPEREQLWAAVDQLTEEHKQALLGYEVEELSVSEIASLASVPQKTVYSRLAAARRLLRELLVAQGWAWLLSVVRGSRRCLAAGRHVPDASGVDYLKLVAAAQVPVVCCLMFLAPSSPLPLESGPAAIGRSAPVADAALELPRQPLLAAHESPPSAAPIRKTQRVIRKRGLRSAGAQPTAVARPDLRVVYVGSVERPEGELPFGFERVPERVMPRVTVRGPRDAVDGILRELVW